MNDQLKRIKTKDLTKIDEKIFEEQNRADSIGATLSHLSDFQKFLLEQIANMDKNQLSTNSSLIAKSIARNFDHLKESLVKCSRIQEKCEKVQVITLKEQLQSLREQLKKTKQAIKQQVRQTEMKNNQVLQACLHQAYEKIGIQKIKNEELYRKYELILAQNQKLKKQDQELKAKAVQIQKPSIAPIEAVNYLPCKVFTQVNYRTPLRETQNIKKVNSNFAVKQEEWKITRNQITQGLYPDEKRTASLKRQTSNHQLSRKPHINCLEDKQNENLALKCKGVIVEQLKRGKSKQKIKLFSMI